MKNGKRRNGISARAWFYSQPGFHAPHYGHTPQITRPQIANAPAGLAAAMSEAAAPADSCNRCGHSASKHLKVGCLGSDACNCDPALLAEWGTPGRG